MDFLFILIAVFFLVSKVIKITANSISNLDKSSNETPLTFNNYITHNHLHITEKQAEKLKNKN